MKLCALAWSASIALLGLLSAGPAAAAPGTTNCLDGTPARPVDQFRTMTGQGTFGLWPTDLRPAGAAGQPLPADRDSTLYNGFARPGFYSFDVDGDGIVDDLEFYNALEIVEGPDGTHLYMAYNSGLQIWDIGGAFAAAPLLLAQRDGWFGDFWAFEPPQTEYYFKIWDVAAIDPADAPGETLVSLSGDPAVGPTIWDARDKLEPVQLYQDLGNVTFQVVAANIGGRSYAFQAATNGIHVYDMTRAREIGPCFENTNVAVNLCGGNSNPVWRGRLEPWPWGRTRYLSVLEAEIGGATRHFIAASDYFLFNGLGTEIREITDVTSRPPASAAVVEGLSDLCAGVELFMIPELPHGLRRFYLGAINGGTLEIYDVTACLAPASVPAETCALDEAHRKYSQPLGPLPSHAYVEFSEGNYRPFLYQGHHTLCSRPSAAGEGDVEHLLDLNGLATGEPIVDVRGETYLDPNHTVPTRRIDYWSSYYDQATDGFSAFAPLGGRFHGAYFYRAAQTVFDVHEWTGAAGAGVNLFADGFESGDVAVWSDSR